MEKSTQTCKKQIKAVFTAPEATPSLVIRDTHFPTPSTNEAVVKVVSFSLNQGETRTAMAATKSYTPGWDFAGIIEQPSADESTPKKGSRVFGFLPQGSWAEFIAVPGGLMAGIPDGVSFSQAASLPVAGVTALVCLEAAGNLVDRRVLITGAAGGVGRFACQFAALAGAKVFAVSRRPELPNQLKNDGIDARVFITMAEAKDNGMFDVILDSVGGDILATALTLTTENGICINCGNSSRQPTAFNVRSADWLFHRVQCIWLGRQLDPNSTPALEKLIDLVKQGFIRTSIDIELPWSEVYLAAEKLIGGKISGKVILNII
jgi:NADPH2:quinone reductase